MHVSWCATSGENRASALAVQTNIYVRYTVGFENCASLLKFTLGYGLEGSEA